MGKLRKTKSSGKGKINTTRYGRRFKSKYDKSKYTVKMTNIREKWNSKKSLKWNMKKLGLVYDINADIKVQNKINEGMEFQSIESLSLAQNVKEIPMEVSMEVVGEQDTKKRGSKKEKKKSRESKRLQEEFQSRSLVPERNRCHLATAETEYLVPLIKKYGTNYKKMARDKDNYDQKTESQLRKKCEQLLSSTETRHLKLCDEFGLFTESINS